MKRIDIILMVFVFVTLEGTITCLADDRYNEACDISMNCSTNQFCMNGLCKCQPNYEFTLGSCRKSSCYMNNRICEISDPNRYCEEYDLFKYGRCICKPGFIEDPKTKACRKLCTENDGLTCENMDGQNSVCNIYRCQCKANHRRNSDTGECEPFKCEIDSHCWTEGDILRSCVNNTCSCQYEEDPMTQRCYLRIGSLLNLHYYQTWRSERILLLTIIIVPIIFYYCLCQNYRKAKSTIVYLKNPSPGQTFYSHQGTITKSALSLHDTNDKRTIQFATNNDDNIKYQRFD